MFSILVILILLFCVLTNLVIGCYVATLLGYGPSDWKGALKMLVDVDRFQGILLSLRQRIPTLTFRKKSDEGDPEKRPDPSAGQTQEDPQVAAETSFESVMEKLASTDLGDLLDDETDDIVSLAPMQEIFDDDLASVLMERGTETWFVNEKHIETSLLKLNVVMMKSGKFSAELDWRIRSARGLLSEGDIRQFRDEMKADCENYLESQAAITEQMKSRLDEFGELKNLAEEVEFANMEQSSQIETTVSNLDRMNLSQDAEQLGTQLIKELANLRIARHRLRDMQDRTYMKIVFYEDRLDTVPQQLFYDEVFGVRGRIGLEAAIHEWWKQKRNQTRQITFALLDFVKFGEVNLEHGIAICDKAIKSFGLALVNRFDPMDLVGIYNGNCFMVATINAGPKKTITEIERVRQNCEATTYRYNGGNDSLQLQVTCAITEALADQSSEAVLTNLEKTLAASKKAGRNHTFYFVPGPLNKPPELVAAPNLGEEPQTISLD